jgi:hypothetical protein
MNTRNVLVKIAYGIIAALVIVLVGLLIYQQHLIRQMADEKTSASSTVGVTAENGNPNDINASLKGSVPSGKGVPAPEVDELIYQLESTEEELEMTRSDLADEMDKQAEKSSEFIAMQKKMLENPATRKLIRTNFENAMDTTYGDLFETLGLSDEKIQELKGLFADHQMEAMETAFDMMGQSLSEEEKKETATMLEAQNSEFEDQVKDLLGSEDYEVYEAYHDRLAERQYTTTFTDSLSDDEGLTAQQEEELIEAMYQARKEVEAEYNIGSEVEEIADPTAAMDKQLEHMDRLFESYTESARSVLSESQALQFETKMKEQQEMMKVSLEMARTLYGGGTGTQDTSAAP